jgi:hypothetical protein
LTTYTFTGAVAYDRLGSSWRTAVGLRSVSVTDPATGLLPANLTQGGLAVTWLTADANSRYSFTCDVPGVVVDFGAGAEALYANEVPGLAIAAGGATTTAIDAHLGGDATGLVATVALKLDATVASSTYVAADQDVVDDFNRPDGALGNTLTGQPWTATGPDLPAIVGGAMTSVGVGYAYVVLPAKVHSLGADFTFSAGATSGVAVMLVSGSSTTLDLNNLGLHLQITPVDWTLQVRVAGETPFPTLASGSFPVPLAQDGTTLYRATATIEGNTATVSLPGGQGVTVTDARIGAQTGQVPCWEVYAGGGAAQASFHAVWSTKVGNPPTRRAGLASDLDLAKVAARIPGRIGCRVVSTWADPVPTGVVTPITWGTETYDTHDFHDVVTNTSRLTIPAGQGGLYAMSGVWVPVATVGTAATRVITAILVNGVNLCVAEAPGGVNTSPTVTTDYPLVPGDYVEFGVYQDSGGTIVTSSAGMTAFTLRRVSD